jgi:dTDP-4-amino-4,6-dideoxygalactose transaminase
MITVPAQEIVIAKEDRDSILAEIAGLLEAGQLSAGNNVERFEADFARYVGVRHAVAVASGTTALELTLLALGVRGRSVIVPANTNFATFVAAWRAGARVVLADADPGTLAPRRSDLAAVATPDTAAVLLVHMGGLITHETPDIAQWCRSNNIALVEDAAHAHGSLLGGQHAGTFGAAGAFSFFATKVITSGEGGMVTTDDSDLAAEIRLYRNLGKAEAWVSRHSRMGTNGRMTELAAVVGRQQLARLDQHVLARRSVADWYEQALGGIPEITMLSPWHPYSGYKVVCRIAPEIDRDALRSLLAAAGVQLAGEVYAEPLHHQPVLAEQYGQYQFPGAEEACSRQICLPVYPTLDPQRLQLVANALTHCVGPASMRSRQAREHATGHDRGEHLGNRESC